jgi:hypothetical protein
LAAAQAVVRSSSRWSTRSASTPVARLRSVASTKSWLTSGSRPAARAAHVTAASAFRLSQMTSTIVAPRSTATSRPATM